MKNDQYTFRLSILIFTGFFLLFFPVYSQQLFEFTYLASWGDEGSGSGQFKNPLGLSVDPMGFLYIADTGNQRIQKIDQRGRFVTSIGGFGWQAEQFNDAVSIWADNGLDVFVSDYNNHRIQRFDKDLHFLSVFQNNENWPDHLQFGFPLDAELSSQGELFCLDGENQRILKLDVQGNPQRTFGDFDSGSGRLVAPRKILITRNGNILVSDHERHAILVYDFHGNFLFQIGKSILKAPEDMAEFPGQYIAVADLSGIFIFNFKGELISRLAEHPQSGFRFKEVVDVAVFQDRMFVLDRNRHSVDVFKWRLSVKGDF